MQRAGLAFGHTSPTLVGAIESKSWVDWVYNEHANTRKAEAAFGGLRTSRATQAQAGNAAVPERVPPRRGSLTHARPSCTAASTRSALGEPARKLKKCNAVRAASCRIPRGSPTAEGCRGTSVYSKSEGSVTAAVSARLGSSQRLSSSASSEGRRGCMDAGGGGPRGCVDGENWRRAPRTRFAVLAEIGHGGHSPPPPDRRPSSPPLSKQKDQKAPLGERVREHVPNDAVRGDMGQWGASLRAHPVSSSGNLACRLAASISQPSGFRENPLQRLVAGERGDRR